MRLLLLLLLSALSVAANLAHAGEDAFSRTRHKAALLALLHYNPLPAGAREFACQRAQLLGLCHAFVQEGGYDPKRTAGILGINDPEVEHLALLVRELDGKKEDLPRPGALPLAGAVALAYTLPCADGLRASVHAARFVSADPDQTAFSKAAYSMIVYAIEGKITNKEELLQAAAINADDAKIEQEIRAVTLRELRKLPPENTAPGRFCRAAFVWHRSQGWEQTMTMGRHVLQYPETMQYLAILTAAWLDLRGLPEDFVWSSLQEKETRDLSADLHQLASNGVLTAVNKNLLLPPEPNAKPNAADSEQPLQPLAPLAPVAALDAQQPAQPAATAATSPTAQTPTTAGQAVASATQPLTPDMPATPALPEAPAQPGSAGTPATMTVSKWSREQGDQTTQASLLLPEMESPAPLPERSLPATPAPAPIARAMRPFPQAPELAETAPAPAQPKTALLPAVGKAQRAATPKAPASSAVVIAPAEGLPADNFPLE